MKLPLPVRLSKQAFASLIDVLESVNSPLGDLSRRLWQSPCASSSTTAVGSSIAALLQDDLLPDPPQRLIAIFVLYDMIAARSAFPSSSSSVLERLIASPLSIILFELMSETNTYSSEKLFLSHLLRLSEDHHSQSSTGDLPTDGEIAKTAAVALYGALEDAFRSGASVATPNISSLRHMWAERHPESSENSYGLKPISAVVRDPDRYVILDSGRLVDELSSVVALEDFAPTFVRIPPPFLPIELDSKELRWIDPEPLHEIIWDPEMGMKGERGAELREIISKAIKSPIPEAQRMKVRQMLNDDPKLVHLCGINPQKLPELVNNNASLATEILLKLMSSTQMPKYLDALVNMDMNLQSMDIVSRLSNTVQLPREFMHAYISNCMRSCGDIPDKPAQDRSVRFFCVFLKRLIKNKNIDLQDLLVEVQEFCMGYCR
ncbi:CCR4-NOT transcription complex subunit 11 [Gracilaria domingensis]|nr:CCR4-NOT transcription complex subunit 11 [Gracilaria domingensis]